MRKLVLLISLLISDYTFARIISMAPAITETLFAVGLGSDVVGISQYCQYPKKSQSIARVGTPFTPNLEKIASLAPELVLTQDLSDNVFSEKLSKLKLKVKKLPFNSFDDVLTSIKFLVDKSGSSKGSEILKGFSKIKAKLELLKMKGSVAVVVEVKLRHGKVTELMLAGPKTYLGAIANMSGLSPYSHSKGYRYISMEKLLLNPPTFIYLIKAGDNEETRLKTFLKARGLGKTRVINYKSEYANIPGPRLRLLMRDIYEFHRN